MSGDSEALTHSRRLFVDSNGLPLSFCMRPGTERSRVKPLIEHGGGTISNNVITNCIRLAVRGSIALHPQTVASDYIDNCVKENRLLDVKMFYLNPPAAKPEDSDSDSSMGLSEQKYRVNVCTTRRDYTFSEQKLIVDFICKYNFHRNVKGNKVWKKLEKKEVLSRTWQSMKQHYRTTIIRQLHLYPITRKDRQLMLSIFPNIEDPDLRLRGPKAKKMKVATTTTAEEDMIIDSEESEDSEMKIPVTGTSAALRRLPTKEQNLLLNLDDASSPHKTESIVCDKLTTKSPVVVLKTIDTVEHPSSLVSRKYFLGKTQQTAVASGAVASEAVASEAVASGAVASGAVASEAVASEAVASGAVASEAVASGAVASGAVASGASPELFPCGKDAGGKVPSSAGNVPAGPQSVELVGILQGILDKNANASNESNAATCAELIEEIGKPTGEDLQRMSRKQLLNHCVAKRGERNMLLSQMTKEHFAGFLTNMKKRTMLEMLESHDISEDFDKLDLELNSFVSSTSEDSDTDNSDTDT